MVAPRVAVEVAAEGSGDWGEEEMTMMIVIVTRRIKVKEMKPLRKIHLIFYW